MGEEIKLTGTISDADTIDSLMTELGIPATRWRQYSHGYESHWVEVLDKDGRMEWRAPTFQPDFLFDLYKALGVEKRPA